MKKLISMIAMCSVMFWCGGVSFVLASDPPNNRMSPQLIERWRANIAEELGIDPDTYNEVFDDGLDPWGEPLAVPHQTIDDSVLPSTARYPLHSGCYPCHWDGPGNQRVLAVEIEFTDARLDDHWLGDCTYTGYCGQDSDCSKVCSLDTSEKCNTDEDCSSQSKGLCNVTQTCSGGSDPNTYNNNIFNNDSNCGTYPWSSFACFFRASSHYAPTGDQGLDVKAQICEETDGSNTGTCIGPDYDGRCSIGDEECALPDDWTDVCSGTETCDPVECDADNDCDTGETCEDCVDGVVEQITMPWPATCYEYGTMRFCGSAGSGRCCTDADCTGPDTTCNGTLLNSAERRRGIQAHILDTLNGTYGQCSEGGKSCVDNNDCTGTCDKLDLDFEDYDGDGDGNIDAMLVVWPRTMPSTRDDPFSGYHVTNSHTTAASWDGKDLGNVAWMMEYEYGGMPKSKTRHEFVHLFGVPDVYDDSNSSKVCTEGTGADACKYCTSSTQCNNGPCENQTYDKGLGGFSYMDKNGVNGHWSMINPWYRWLFEWVDPEIVTHSGTFGEKTLECRTEGPQEIVALIPSNGKCSYQTEAFCDVDADCEDVCQYRPTVTCEENSDCIPYDGGVCKKNQTCIMQEDQYPLSEMFLIETACNTGLDYNYWSTAFGAVTDGVVIWHVDGDRIPSQTSQFPGMTMGAHGGISIVEADGDGSLGLYNETSNNIAATDLFRGLGDDWLGPLAIGSVKRMSTNLYNDCDRLLPNWESYPNGCDQCPYDYTMDMEPSGFRVKNFERETSPTAWSFKIPNPANCGNGQINWGAGEECDYPTLVNCGVNKHCVAPPDPLECTCVDD